MLCDMNIPLDVKSNMLVDGSQLEFHGGWYFTVRRTAPVKHYMYHQYDIVLKACRARQMVCESTLLLA